MSNLPSIARSFSSFPSLSKFNVIIVGGGHAGCEAAAASARSGARTLLLTHKKSTVGEMSCNPSFGGIGKGHLIREVDALDGVCGRICDKSAVTYQALNRAAGPAVIGLRAQIDRKLYKKNMQDELFENTENLYILEGAVEDLLLDEATSPNQNPKVKGCVLADGQVIEADSVVITTGTFLSAEIYQGNTRTPAGRIGDPASYGLSKTFKKLGFKLGRLRTGTPPRLLSSSIDFTKFKLMPPDNDPILFSFLSEKVWLAPEHQKPTYLGYTNPELAKIVLDNMVNNKGFIAEVHGPRYCPSLEMKVTRFPKLNHRMFLEHEGLDSDLIYPQGMSMTFSEDIQLKIMRSISGLESCEIVQPGYGVHYDFVNPQQLKRTLETKIVKGLFLAGQINGTTGYEEAAAQGVLAGLNAGLSSQDKKQLALDRSQAYLGVLIDDLTSLGTSEPYRMFTSRVEFRLHLRPDNADLRLTELARNHNGIRDERFVKFFEVKGRYTTCKEILEGIKLPLHKWSSKLKELKPKTTTKVFSAFDMLGRFEIPLNSMVQLFPEDLKEFQDDKNLDERLRNEARYSSQQERMVKKVEEMKEEMTTLLPENLDYSKMVDINLECREKLASFRPGNIAAASRVPGVTPDVLVALLRYARREDFVEAR